MRFLCSLMLMMTALAGFAQVQPKKLSYAVTISIDPGDVMQEVIGNKSKDSALQEAQKELEVLFQNGVEKKLVYWREGDEVVGVDPTEGEGEIRKYYNVETLAYRVIDSFTYRRMNRVDSLNVSMDYRRFRGWKVNYSVKKLKGEKKILGFTCQQYRIRETKKTNSFEGLQKREIIIWATDAIQPALSTHAILGFYSKILPGLTPLEIIEIPGGAQKSFGRSVAVGFE